MSDREQYKPGPASGAHVRKDEGKWALVLMRELLRSPEQQWFPDEHLQAAYALDGNRSPATGELPFLITLRPHRTSQLTVPSGSVSFRTMHSTLSFDGASGCAMYPRSSPTASFTAPRFKYTFASTSRV